MTSQSGPQIDTSSSHAIQLHSLQSPDTAGAPGIRAADTPAIHPQGGQDAAVQPHRADSRARSISSNIMVATAATLSLAGVAFSPKALESYKSTASLYASYAACLGAGVMKIADAFKARSNLANGNGATLSREITLPLGFQGKSVSLSTLTAKGTLITGATLTVAGLVFSGGAHATDIAPALVTAGSNLVILGGMVDIGNAVVKGVRLGHQGQPLPSRWSLCGMDVKKALASFTAVAGATTVALGWALGEKPIVIDAELGLQTQAGLQSYTPTALLISGSSFLLLGLAHHARDAALSIGPAAPTHAQPHAQPVTLEQV